MDDQLPPDPHFLATSQNDQAYSLIFDFTDPPPLPLSKTKARDAIPKGPRTLETDYSEMDRLANTNQPGSLTGSSGKRSIGGPAPHRASGATINGLLDQLDHLRVWLTIQKALLHTPFPPNRYRYHDVIRTNLYEESSVEFPQSSQIHCLCGLQSVLFDGRWLRARIVSVSKVMAMSALRVSRFHQTGANLLSTVSTFRWLLLKVLSNHFKVTIGRYGYGIIVITLR